MFLTDLPPAELIGQRIRFEDADKIYLNSLDNSSWVIPSGDLKVVDVYDQHYLIAYSLTRDNKGSQQYTLLLF